MIWECIVCVCIIWVLYKLIWKRSPLDGIPGPKQIPILGNALQVDQEKFHVNFLRWYKQHGPIVRLKLLYDEFILVSDADDIREMLVTRGQEFAGRWKSYRIQLSSEDYKDIITSDMSTEVKWRRKIMHSYIKQFGSGMDEIEKITDELAEQLVCKLYENGQKDSVGMNYTFYSVTMDILAVMLVGDILEDKDTKDMMYKIIPLIMEAFNPSLSGIILDRFPWTRYFGNSVFKSFQKVRQMRQKLVASLIDLQSKQGVERGFIKKLLMVFKDDANHDTSYEVLEQQIFIFILGGTLTTSTTLTVLTNALVHHPSVQAKLQEEVQCVVGYDRSVTIRDKPEMPYHMATIYEISRLVSVVFFLPHKTMKETHLGGYKIPKGTIVIPNNFAMHHDERLWSKPFAFVPERFLDEDGNLVPADHPNRRHLMPFGAGARVCVGEMLAISRIFLILAKMMQKLTLLPATTLEEQPSFDPRQHKSHGGLIEAPEVKVRIQPITIDG